MTHTGEVDTQWWPRHVFILRIEMIYGQNDGIGGGVGGGGGGGGGGGERKDGEGRGKEDKVGGGAGGGAGYTETWVISQGFGCSKDGSFGSDVTRFAYERGRSRMKCLLPYVAVAARVACDSAPSSFIHNRLEGRIFCTLPVGNDPTHLPVHCDGRWELDSQRRHLQNEPGAMDTTNQVSLMGLYLVECV